MSKFQSSYQIPLLDPPRNPHSTIPPTASYPTTESPPPETQLLQTPPFGFQRPRGGDPLQEYFDFPLPNNSHMLSQRVEAILDQGRGGIGCIRRIVTNIQPRQSWIVVGLVDRELVSRAGQATL